jgi:hypothetical protein
MARLHDRKGMCMTRRYTITLTEQQLDDLLYTLPTMRPYSDLGGQATRLWNLRSELMAQTREGPNTIGVGRAVETDEDLEDTGELDFEEMELAEVIEQLELKEDKVEEV